MFLGMNIDCPASADVSYELKSLADRYAAAVDARDAAALASIFTADARLRVRRTDGPGAEYLDAASIGDIAPKMARYERTFHFLGQARYSHVPGSDAARGEVYCIAHHMPPVDSPTDRILHIRYHDDYRRQDGAWYIADRLVNIDFATSAPNASSL